MKKARASISPLPPIDERRRYPIPVGADYLGCSNSYVFKLMREKRIQVIRDGGRTYIPGSEIVRLSTIAA